MNDIRRTILWVIFGFSLVLLWDQWQVYNGNKPTFLPSTKSSAPADPAATPAAANANGVPAAAAPAAGAVPVQGSAPAIGEKVTVSTDLFKATIDGEGGTLSELQLLQFLDQTNHGGLVEWFRRLVGLPVPQNEVRPVLLMENGSPATRYVAQTGLLNTVDTGDRFPNHLSLMTARPGPRELADGQNKLEVVFESQPVGGLKYVKTYTFLRGDYSIRVNHQVVNVSDKPLDPQLYLQFTRHGTVAAGTMFGTNTFTGPAIYTEQKKFQKIDFSAITKGKVELPAPTNNGWVAMVQHYFVSAWLLNVPGSDAIQREFRVADLGNNLFSVAMVLKLPQLAPGAAQTVDSNLFAGPEEEKKLEAIAPGLDLVKDYGIFAIISKPLYWLLNKLHGILGNWGWAIVALVVLLKAAFYWLNAKAYASMAKMKAINPKIMEMRERLKDKPQEMQQEMMRIYREEKVNPMGGCFPIVIQIPVFIALYWVLLSSVEMRHAPWILWIHDLSAPDPWFILPVVMTATSLFQTWLNPTPPDPMQAKLMWIMPLAFSVMFIFFPAGLVLYWITNNVLSIAQQWFINKRLGVLGNPSKTPKLAKPAK
ncbi:membrane protein insertase YidC [Variovorax saccharolyticus]|uniref:membrane protein insertase YidC n=1 Tax=Variovorax saccharolyticus TaxID=3053516 RepID=UPI0025779DCE|nr:MULTISPECIES: membrane protein insertase YidC [unclassified Variovorax]MDM0021542.1 membrane protein insertase YidC [Variovorax sp. J22R187]MDM0028199.1 membrane protein insertase YidC [Variovorax sp. J31P216]